MIDFGIFDDSSLMFSSMHEGKKPEGISGDDNSDDENNNNNDFIKATEIQYILENSKPTVIELPENELEESIFKNENACKIN